MPGGDASFFPSPVSWAVAIHASARDRTPLGAGVVIDPHRVLTAAHVLRPAGVLRDEVWVAFPRADLAPGTRRRVRRIVDDGGDDFDIAVLELDEPVPPAVTPAMLRCPAPDDLRGRRWWAFGFPKHSPQHGDEARGTVLAPGAYGVVTLTATDQTSLEVGFSGGAVWSPEYDAVVGVVIEAGQGGRGGGGRALTLHGTDRNLPHLGLAKLGRWSPEAAGEGALSAWGWSLAEDPQGVQHWRPRARGVASDREPGHRFRGRTTALHRISSWLDEPAPAHRLLVVTGSPGAGKSAVLGRVVTTADAGIRARLPADDTAVRASLGSVSCAVHAKGRTALEVAQEIARAAAVTLPREPAELVGALARRLGAGTPFNLVIDALDEARDPAQVMLIVREVLVPLVGRGAELGARVLVGTRRGDAAEELLGAVAGERPVIDLDGPTYLDAADLIGYVTATLQLRGAERDGNPYAREAVAAPLARRIAGLAEGNFLIAGLVARAHGLTDTAPVDTAAVSFTSTVDAALDAYLAGLPELGSTSARLALTVLAYAQAPGLPLGLWRIGVNALGGRVDERQLAEFSRSAAANFLVETGSPPEGSVFRLFHQALDDALLRYRARTSTAVDDERRLVTAWLRTAAVTDWAATAGYLERSLALHARRGDVLDEALGDDGYLLHADLPRLLATVDECRTPAGVARARLLQRTPQAAREDPAERAAMFSVVEALDRLGTGFAAPPDSPYRARWAETSRARERTILDGHTGAVVGVCPVPVDGHELLASVDEDGAVRLWDPRSGQLDRPLGKPGEAQGAVCAVRAGGRTLLAAGGQDATVSVWDPATGELCWQTQKHDDWIRALCAVTVAGRQLLVSAGDDETVIVWNPATGAPVRVLAPHRGWITAVCAVPVGGHELLAVAGFDGTVQLWDPATGAALGTVPGGGDGVTSLVAVDLGGAAGLAVAGHAGIIRCWRMPSGALVRTVETGAGTITGLCPAGTGRRAGLVSADENGRLSVWNLATGLGEGHIDAHAEPVRGVCTVLHGGTRLVASASDDGTVRLWDLAEHRASTDGASARPAADRRAAPDPGPVPVLCAVAARDGMLVASAAEGGPLRVWRPDTGERAGESAPVRLPVTAACAIPDGPRTLVVSSHEFGRPRVWDLDADGTGSDRPVPGIEPRGVCTLRRAGRPVVAAIGEQAIYAWDPVGGRTETILQGFSATVTAYCAVPVAVDDLLVLADEEGTVQVWDPARHRRRWARKAYGGPVTAACAVWAGTRWLVVTAGADHTVKLWELADGALAGELRGHTRTVNGLCALDWGARQILASASDDRTVRLWDPTDLSLVRSIPVHRRALACAAVADTLVVGLDTGLLALSLRVPRAD